MATITAGDIDLTTAIDLQEYGVLVSTDVIRASSTSKLKPYTSQATIQKGQGTFNDGSGDNAKHYNIFPYLVRGLTGDGGVNRGTGIPTINTLDKLNILQIGEYSTITKIVVEVDIDNRTVATDTPGDPSTFGQAARSAGYSGSQLGGYIGCNIRFDNDNESLTTATIAAKDRGVLTQSASEQEIQSVGEATYTFTFYNSGNALTTTTGSTPGGVPGGASVDLTPNNIRNLLDSSGLPITGTAEEISFGIHLTHEAHGMLPSEANDDEGLFRYVNDVRVKIEYTGKTNFETGFTLWPNTTFPGKNTTGSSDYENIAGARTLVNVLTNGLTNTTDTSIRGFMFNTQSPADALTTEDTVVAANGTAGQENPPFIVWGDDENGASNPWINNTIQVFDKDNDDYEIASSTDADDYVFNFAWRYPLLGVASGSMDFTTTATMVQNHNMESSEIDTFSSAFDTGSTLAGFLLEADIDIDTAFTKTLTQDQIGIILKGFTVSPSLTFTTAFDGQLALTGVAIGLGNFTLTNTALGTVVAHTTGASGNMAFATSLGLAGRIRTGFTTNPQSAFNLPASAPTILTKPTPAQVFTTPTLTRTFVIPLQGRDRAHERTLYIDQQTRTFTIPLQGTDRAHERHIFIDEQTRTIKAEALEE